MVRAAGNLAVTLKSQAPSSGLPPPSTSIAAQAHSRCAPAAILPEKPRACCAAQWLRLALLALGEYDEAVAMSVAMEREVLAVKLQSIPTR